MKMMRTKNNLILLGNRGVVEFIDKGGEIFRVYLDNFTVTDVTFDTKEPEPITGKLGNIELFKVPLVKLRLELTARISDIAEEYTEKGSQTKVHQLLSKKDLTVEEAFKFIYNKHLRKKKTGKR